MAVKVAALPVDTSGLLTSATDYQDPYAKGGQVKFASAPVVSVEKYTALAASHEAAFESAISDATAANTRLGVVEAAVGKTYTWTTRPPRILAACQVWLKGNRAKLQGNSTAIRPGFDLWRVADNDTFTDVEVTDWLVDCNNVVPATNQHVVFGNLIGGAWGQRVNVNRCAVRRCRTINVPTAPTLTATGSDSGGSLGAATYYFKVAAVLANGEIVSNEANSGARAGGSSSVALAWAATPNATAYNLYIGTSAAGENVKIALGNVTSYTYTGQATTGASVPASGQWQNVSIGSAHLASSEGTTNTLTDLVFEDLDLQGGSYGVTVIGGGSVTAGLGINVFIDRVTRRNVRHDTLRTPTAFFAEANFQVGGYAYGGTVRSYGCYGANSGDVGDEIDNMLNAFEDAGCVHVDAWNASKFSRNFRLPGTTSTATYQQRHVWNGTAITRNIDPRIDNGAGTAGGAGANQHFCVGGDQSTAGYAFGHAIFRGKSVFESAFSLPSQTGYVVSARTVQFRELTIDIEMDCPNLVVNNGSGSTQNPVFLDIRSMTTGAVVNIERLAFRFAGSRAGANGIQWKMVRLSGTDSTIRIRNFIVDLAGLTGLGASDTFYWQGFGLDFGSTTLRIDAEAPRFATAPSGGIHQGVWINSTSNLTITGLAKITGGEMAKLVGLSGFDYNIDSTQVAKVAVLDYLASSSRGGGVGNAVASAATITAPPGDTYISVTGTTTITSVTASYKGRRITLVFAGILTFTDGSNLKLAGDFVTTADDAITLVCDGTNWIETGRSVN